MKNLKMFVGIRSSYASNPIAQAVKLVFGGGTTIVDVLVDASEVEADVAVVNSVENALRAIKETEKTLVIIFSLSSHEQAAAAAFAARFPERVKEVSYLDSNLVVKMADILNNKSKEVAR